MLPVRGRETTSYLGPRRRCANKSGKQYTTATMGKCLLAGAGTNRRCSPGCSELLGSAGSPQINYPHLLHSEGMGGSLPESPSNLFLVFGEPALVPVTLRRQAGKSQQPQLAVWMLVGGELTAQESVLGTADMFKWRGRSQTKMLVSKAWKLYRVTPRCAPALLGSGDALHGDAGAARMVGSGGGRWEEERSFPTSQAGRCRVALPWMTARAPWHPYSSAGVWQAAAQARGNTGHPLRPGSSAPRVCSAAGLACFGRRGRAVPYLT